MRNICVVITARPSYSRVKSLLRSIKKNETLTLQLVVAASALLDRYGRVVDNILSDGFEVEEEVFVVLEGENSMSMAKTTGIAVIEFTTVFNKLKPDIVVVIADRFETLAISIAAAYQNIPLCHIQGGEVTGNIDEKVRHANTKLADIHIVATEKSKERVIRLGEAEKFVFNTGCPSVDLAKDVMINPTIRVTNDIYKKYGGVGHKPDLGRGYAVVMQHPVTTEHTASRNQITSTLRAISNIQIPILWFWPNVDSGADGTSSGIRHFRENNTLNQVHFFKNMEPEDFLNLLYNSIMLIGNSSVGIRECSFMGVPVINIGTRQNMRERGPNVMDVGYDENEIIQAYKRIIEKKRPKQSFIYGDGESALKITNILESVELNSHKTLTY
jgi:UDP-hydrolysing UDP-N-acetyl-D-glucosamine 2-epimerase